VARGNEKELVDVELDERANVRRAKMNATRDSGRKLALPGLTAMCLNHILNAMRMS